MTLPVCIITGRIAGDSEACGDCDPCSATHTVPDVVKRLLADKEEWRDKYGSAMGTIDAAAQRLNESGTGEMGLIDTIHAAHAILRGHG